MTTLSNEEKVGIAQQHLRNLQINRYNIELSLKEEQAVSEPSDRVIQDLTDQAVTFDLRIAAIQAEISSLS
jgi:hypothetical protein